MSSFKRDAEVVHISRLNHSYLEIRCEPSIAKQLSDHFSYFLDGAQFSPKYKLKIWDGKIRLFNLRDGTLPFGLLSNLIEFCRYQQYKPILNDNCRVIDYEVSLSAIEQFAKGCNLHDLSGPLEPYDYQLNAVHQAVRLKRVILLSSTSSGKSLMIYLIAKFLLEVKNVKRILLVVPTVNLVNQMVSDFAEYEANSSSRICEYVHPIFEGQKKIETSARLYVSTWQSIQNLPDQYFKLFGCIVGDEAHTYKGDKVRTIVERCVNAQYRIGTTGTLDDKKAHRLLLQGLFGPIKVIMTNREQAKHGRIADLKINCIHLKYKDEEFLSKVRVIDTEARGKPFKSIVTFKQEYDIVNTYYKKHLTIAHIALRHQLNTVVMFNGRKIGKSIFDLLSSMTDRPLYYIDGDTDADVRESIRKAMNNETNAILVGSYKTISTGINIKNLNVLILATPTKSLITILQSIGRLLRKGNINDVILYDIIDDLCIKKYKNFLFKHFEQRFKIYQDEHFKVAQFNISI